MLDYDLIRKKLRNPRSRLFAVVKEELNRQGYWRVKARGNPKAGYAAKLAKVQTD